jgi:hypothetical protein
MISNLPEGARIMRLIEYQYDELRRLVLWKVQDLTPNAERQVITLAYLVEDLGLQFNLDFSKAIQKLILKLGAEKAAEAVKKCVVDFSETMRLRPWPFTMTIIPTAQMIDKYAVTKDFKEELEKMKQGEKVIDVGKINATNENVIKYHDNLDMYPYYEIIEKINEGTL